MGLFVSDSINLIFCKYFIKWDFKWLNDHGNCGTNRDTEHGGGQQRSPNPDKTVANVKILKLVWGPISDFCK